MTYTHGDNGDKELSENHRDSVSFPSISLPNLRIEDRKSVV